MKQKQYAPLSVAEMGLVLYVANEGYLADIEIKKVLDFEAALLSYANAEYADLLAKVNEKGDWSNDIEAQYKALVEKFKSTQTW
jgi:F-type H+-transporting ATPase subunit alpha